MAIYKPGRLYRKLAWLPKPLFAIQTPNIGTVTDNDIQSIVINRGKSDNSGGVHPSTVEVHLANNLVAKSNETIVVVLRTVVTTALAKKWTTDPAMPASIRSRFQGRVGRQEMLDLGFITRNSIMGASWSAQLSYAPDVHTLPSGTSVQTLLERILKPDYLASKITVTSQGTFDTTYGDVTGKYSDLIGKFAGDIGILIRDLRAGGLEVLNMPYRQWQALNYMPVSAPLTRAQALSPATWAQPNEMPAVEYRLKYRDAANVVKTIVTSIPGTVTGTAPVEDLDWTYFKADTNQWRYVHGLRASGFDDRFRAEEITVDLLELLDSEFPYHWQQAGNMINMEVGAAIYLGEDWPTALRGVHFAEGITETINKDAWEIKLSLIRFRELTGDETTGTIPARVWNQARYAWDTETRKWDEA